MCMAGAQEPLSLMYGHHMTMHEALDYFTPLSFGSIWSINLAAFSTNTYPRISYPVIDSFDEDFTVQSARAPASRELRKSGTTLF